MNSHAHRPSAKFSSPIGAVYALRNITLKISAGLLRTCNNVMCTDKTIRFDPAKFVLEYRVGGGLKLNEADIVRPFSACFAEIESKFA